MDGSCFGKHSCQVQLIWPLFGEPGEPEFSPPVIVSTHPCKVSGLLPSVEVHTKYEKVQMMRECVCFR